MPGSRPSSSPSLALPSLALLGHVLGIYLPFFPRFLWSELSTRCPTECRLARSDSPWQCVVSLRFIVDRAGQPLGQARNQPFGAIIYEKREVEDRIRRAQRAILNPDKALKHFLDEDDKEEFDSQLSFSLNSVTLQISGPDVADLSFCDLPGTFRSLAISWQLFSSNYIIGLIASVSSGCGGNNDIALVHSLVTAYIKKPSCIILLTVACESMLIKFIHCTAWPLIFCCSRLWKSRCSSLGQTAWSGGEADHRFVLRGSVYCVLLTFSLL